MLKKSRSSVTGIVFLTFEVEYPRIVLAELNTHRGLSKNSFSSRAVPFKKMLEQLSGRPVRFGANQSGMQDKGEDFDAPVKLFSGDGVLMELTPEEAWRAACVDAKANARAFAEAGYHKQVYNRLLEPWQMMKTVISGTEWPNYFWLRHHSAADPTLAELARVMWEADKATEAEELQQGEWHLPYLDTWRTPDGVLHYGDVWLDGIESGYIEYSLEDAIKISCARCAAVSYRNEDYGLEKSREVYDRLVGDERKHASAFEHCGTPIKATQHETWIGSNIPQIPETWEAGITHMDRQRNLWSGNIKGWIQYRKLIPGENYVGEY